MKYLKLNKYEKKEMQHKVLEKALHGEGLFLFRNNTKGDLKLPRPTKSGLREIVKDAEFQGDDYYMQLVRQGFLRLVKVIQTPEQQRQALCEEQKMDQKLILDQPEQITEQGKIEHVIAKPATAQKLNETEKQKNKAPDVLLNESPDGFVIVV